MVWSRFVCKGFGLPRVCRYLLRSFERDSYLRLHIRLCPSGNLHLQQMGSFFRLDIFSDRFPNSNYLIRPPKKCCYLSSGAVGNGYLYSSIALPTCQYPLNPWRAANYRCVNRMGLTWSLRPGCETALYKYNLWSHRVVNIWQNTLS